MNIISKPNMGREDGRIIVMKGNKVVMSTHYRNMNHRSILIDAIVEVLTTNKQQKVYSQCKLKFSYTNKREL